MAGALDEPVYEANSFPSGGHRVTEGHVRYLRPAYQAPETVETQAEMDLDVQVGGDGAYAT